MSSYENKRRWYQIGVQTSEVEHSLAPGFGRPHISQEQTSPDKRYTVALGSGEVITSTTSIPTVVGPYPQEENVSQQEENAFLKKLSNVWGNGPSRPVKRRTVPLDIVTTIDLQTASVEEVRDWAQAIVATGASDHLLSFFTFHTTPFEPDFKLFPKKTVSSSSSTSSSPAKKQVSFAAQTKKLPPLDKKYTSDFDFSKIILFGPGKKIDTLTMFPQLIDSCDVPIPLLPCLEENWEKLNLLLWAAYLAKDDLILVKRRTPTTTTTLRHSNSDFYDNISMQKTSSGHTITGRKLFFLYAALFELLPEKNMKTMEQEYHDTWVKLLQLSMNLSPRDDEGLTPLAIAALAKFPISRPCLSTVVIDRILELDPTTAKRVVVSNVKNARRQLPLHLVLQSGKNWDEGVNSIYRAYPEALTVTDSIGRCPLHVAASSLTCPGWVIHKILQLCPEVAKEKDRRGRLPLHHAVDDRETWSAGVESIYVTYPEAAFTPDLNGNLPSYFFPDGVGRNLKTQLEKKVAMECSNNPELLSLFFGDFSSKGVVHDLYQGRKGITMRPFDLMHHLTGGDGSLPPPHRNLNLTNGLNLSILPEFMALLSTPLRQ